MLSVRNTAPAPDLIDLTAYEMGGDEDEEPDDDDDDDGPWEGYLWRRLIQLASKDAPETF